MVSVTILLGGVVSVIILFRMQIHWLLCVLVSCKVILEDYRAMNGNKISSIFDISIKQSPLRYMQRKKTAHFIFRTTHYTIGPETPIVSSTHLICILSYFKIVLNVYRNTRLFSIHFSSYFTHILCMEILSIFYFIKHNETIFIVHKPLCFIVWLLLWAF